MSLARSSLCLEILGCVSVLMFAACASKPPSAAPLDMPPIANEPPPTLPSPSTAEINGTVGSPVHGTAIITNEGKTIHVIAEVTGLPPNSEHGLHVHENGSCDGPKFESAGGHYNPASMKHGGANTKMRHAGDLGNLTADNTGRAKLDVRIPNGPRNDTFGGRSLIVHAKKDDLHSQPAGNSGDRIACGLIVQQK